VARKRNLPVRSDDEPRGLGLTTIMDRALAARFGVAYVHLAAFAIDVDRVNAEHGDEPGWPTGWEVFLTERYLLDTFDLAREADHELLEHACISIIEGGQALGAQLPFAVYDAADRGVWPQTLLAPFATWRRRPRELLAALAELWERADEEGPRLAAACLEAPVEPELAPPTRAALERMAGR